jgi:hypothetical protein
MKKLFFALVIIPSLALALESPFESTVNGITIGNAHEVVPGILRGSEPGKKVSELKDFGVDEVIIFKSQTKTEVDEELAALKTLAIKSHHIPFKWKGLESPQIACEQLVKALQIIRRAQKANRTVFFHCTVGEDRTGMLAGLLSMEVNRISTDSAWTDEMCANGYADGNKQKPWHVASAIHKELTPLFFALAAKVEAGEKLSMASCAGLDPRPTTRTCKK